ncbi:class I SAM-dependent methyltransferase [Marinilabilia salmonicolor]|uniref:Methyltransferase family protein n=1 Tax=Marinilabilia salmonicolor TaxID=989 RepID=A0A368VDC6_9BACT|nr:class I SAM-dependent methyltransferase [Marinilabilia salmonicolor]RCW39297.1 methyltransferase family protein [Marinilabilia salmonicolor]
MKFSKTFGAVYDYLMVFLEKPWLKVRRARLLTGLSGKVLEVGVGTGTNLQYYNHEAQVTGIEPSPHMIKRALKKRDLLLFPERINLHHTGCGYDDMADLVARESLDAVVCTLVLCTIPEPERALCNFMEWLKPGGRLLVLEHIRSHNHSTGKIQDFLTPTWAKIAEGCQLNRPTDKMILQAGFQLIREDHFKIGIPFYEAEYRKPD